MRTPPLRIGFLDRIGWDYTPDTPYAQPLGGSQSALCYLAEALAARGHEVTLFNHVAASTVSRGVGCVSLATERPAEVMARMAGLELLVTLNNPAAAAMLRPLREVIGGGPRMVLWSGHDVIQPAMADLARPEVAGFWDAFALVSAWQARRYVERFALPPEKVFLARNAASPCFEGLFPPGAPISSAKADPPVLVYASPPNRGLDLLLAAFPHIRAAVPGARLKVCSDFAVYRTPREQDPYAPLYAQCQATAGVEFLGSVSQRELAGVMGGAACLAYPCTVEETSCITVMEALAAGCLVITTREGALPETCGEFGFLMPLQTEGFVARYAQLVVAVLRKFGERPEVAEGYRQRQVGTIAPSHRWSRRAEEWETRFRMSEKGATGREF